VNLYECKDLIDNYANWLKEKISVEKIEDIYEITTPFLDRHNDHLQIYLKPDISGNSFVLSDCGYIISDLKLSGMEFGTESRNNIRDIILNGFGVQLRGEELVVEAKKSNFPQKKHNLIQAMISIDDMFCMSKPLASRFFWEDVRDFLTENNIRFTEGAHFVGKSRYSHKFHFTIPSSENSDERVIQAINRPSRENVISFIFSWNDIKVIRPQTGIAYAVLNDREKPVNPDVINALRPYGITPIPWSDRTKFVQKWAA